MSSAKHSPGYRLLEMIPGIGAWAVIFFPIWGSFFVPKLVAYFVIAFLVYWLYQSFKSALFALIGYFKIQSALSTNWSNRYRQEHQPGWLDIRAIHHVIIISSYKEPIEVIDMAFSSLASQIDINLKKLHIVFSQEGRAGQDSIDSTTAFFKSKYASTFGSLHFTAHPAGLPGETAGKHSNEAWAAKYFKKNYIDTGKYQIDLLTLTTCDVDTIFNPKYFSALTYYFASDPNRYLRFWQSPIFWHHNINDVPAPIRIIGTIGNVVHIANLQEPDGIFFNYSCYSASYQLIDLSGYWDVDMIPEDWHIFLQSFFATGGRSAVNPIFLPTIVDAPSGRNYFDALRNRYRQCLRHAWGAIDIPYTIQQARRHPEIPLLTRLLRISKLVETHLIWSSNWFILTLGTSLPTLLNPIFFQTSFGYNLPRIANVILTICLLPLLLIIFLDWKLRPKTLKATPIQRLRNLLQWPLMPVATLTMSVLPGLHSHTRLMLGHRLEYQTTQKT